VLNTVIMHAEPVVSEKKKEISALVSAITKETGKPPKLVAMLIGNDPVSRIYVDLKKKDCEDVGILSEIIDLSSVPLDKVEREVVSALERLNRDETVSAVIPQMPFEGKIKEEKVFSLLSPQKDVDGLTPFNLGTLTRGEYALNSSLLPCTPKGIMMLLDHYGVVLDGADAAIIGRGILVGEPLRKLLQDENATATCYHTHSKYLMQKISEADIVVSGTGRPPEIYGDSSGFRLTGDMVKEGSTVVGVGVAKDPSTGKSLFDVDTKSMKGKCRFLTPNTGGVGAMTRLALIENTAIAARIQQALN
jgi:methylenetetrahydrofolate dehydrogenase (NADP+) / methenyltetrahydrofolate cyclohydrolase